MFLLIFVFAELPKWKTFRWLPWAIENGLWPKEKQEEIRYLRVLTPLKPTPKTPVNEERNVEQLKNEVSLIEKQAAIKEKKNKGKTKKKGSKKGRHNHLINLKF